MYKRTFTYEDFDGNTRTEDCYFNYTQTELTRMNLSAEGGMSALAQKIASERDGKKLCALFEELILGAYGEKSLDGRTFVKSEAISENFKSTMAYDILFTELSTDATKFAEFFNSVIPSNKKIPTDELNKIVAQATASTGI